MTPSPTSVVQAALASDNGRRIWVNAPAGMGVAGALAQAAAEPSSFTGVVVVSSPYRNSLEQWGARLRQYGRAPRIISSPVDAFVALEEKEDLGNACMLVTHAALPRIAEVLELFDSHLALLVIESPSPAYATSENAVEHSSRLARTILRLSEGALKTVMLTHDPYASPWEGFDTLLAWGIPELQEFTGFRPRISVVAVRDADQSLRDRVLGFLSANGRILDSSCSLLDLQSELLGVTDETSLRDEALRLSDAIDDAPPEPRLQAMATLVQEAHQADRPCVVRILRRYDMEYTAAHLSNIGIEAQVISSATDVSERLDLNATVRSGVVLVGGAMLDSSLSVLPASSTVVYWSTPRQLKGFVDAIAIGSRSADVDLQFLASEGGDFMVATALAEMADRGRRFLTAAEWDAVMNQNARS